MQQLMVQHDHLAWVAQGATCWAHTSEQSDRFTLGATWLSVCLSVSASIYLDSVCIPVYKYVYLTPSPLPSFLPFLLLSSLSTSSPLPVCFILSIRFSLPACLLCSSPIGFSRWKLELDRRESCMNCLKAVKYDKLAIISQDGVKVTAIK